MDSLSGASAASKDTSTSPRLISEGRAVAIFIALIAVVAGILLLTHKDHATVPPTTNHQQTGTFALTNSQALARFKQLDGLHAQAYRKRDASLLDSVLTSDSPMRRSAYRDVARLRKDHVLDETTFRTRQLGVRSNTPIQIVVRQVVIQKARFVTEAGQDVSRLRDAVLGTIDWTLRKDNTEWKIFDSSVIRSRRIRSAN